jgi:hypothetical protein
MLENLISQLVEELELPAISPKDENQTFRLPLNPELVVSIKQLEPGMFLFSRIAACPEEKREELFIFLMKANFLGLGTGGSAIGLEADEKFLTLSSALPYEMNYKGFKESIEDFVNYVDYWKDEILKYQKAAQEGLFS